MPAATLEKRPARAPFTALPDTQNSRDDRRLRINRVGIRGLRHPIAVRDSEGETQPTVATLSLAVDLPAHLKGTHMSRFVEVLRDHGRIVDAASLPALLAALQKRLESREAFVELDFVYFRDKAAPISGARGLVDYGVRLAASARGEDVDLTVEVKVPVTTLCPCSKAISAYGAHNQRGYVTLAVRAARPVEIEQAIRLVEESASAEIYSLLKRPDEKHVTERAYENPVFVEDLVRNIALRVKALKGVLGFRVEAENQESIHNHAAYARIDGGEPISL
jgi:GTP cyclohydrolase IB